MIFWFAATGDISFGAGISFPQFSFSDMEILFEVLNDRILEGTEIGELQIAPEPNAFDGHTPLFKSVRIIIRDDEGEMNDIGLCTLVVNPSYNFSAYSCFSDTGSSFCCW